MEIAKNGGMADNSGFGKISISLLGNNIYL